MVTQRHGILSLPAWINALIFENLRIIAISGRPSLLLDMWLWKLRLNSIKTLFYGQNQFYVIKNWNLFRHGFGCLILSNRCCYLQWRFSLNVKKISIQIPILITWTRKSKYPIKSWKIFNTGSTARQGRW